MDSTDIRRSLDGKRIFIVPYCHADIAWEHTRRWHVDRYAKVFEEVLDLCEAEPGFRFFIDSWCEMLAPCLALMPEAAERTRELIRGKRLALCCGHWGNLRMTQVGDETILRNIIMGRRKVRELFPEADLRVYANLDVAVGHSQVPQIMRLADIPFYFAWRPQKALDARGAPRSFHWVGLSGHRVLVNRHAYSGLVSPHERPEGGWESDWDATLRTVWEYVKKPAVQKDLDVLSFCSGMDDSRPLRAWGRDVVLDVPALVEVWNRREKSSMSFAHPLDVFEALAAQAERLPEYKGVLDEAEVCYNAANHGRRGLWWLRELADRRLVEAEIFATLASLKGFDYPSEKLASAWEDLLTICPHAVQDLFREDFDEFELKGRHVVSEAEALAAEAASHVVSSCLAHRAACLTLLNTLGEARSEIVSVLLPNADRTRRRVRFFDARGREAPSQLVETIGQGDEFELLVAADVPACGAASLEMRWSETADEAPPRKVLPSLDATFASDRVRLTFAGGRVSKIEDLAESRSFEATRECGFLDPVFYTYEGPTWLPEKMDTRPVVFEPEQLRVDETGPLRRRITRKGMLGPHSVTQHIDLLAGRPEVEATTEIVVRDGPVSFIGIATPVGEKPRMTADIPFGLEGRDPDSCAYGDSSDKGHENIERRVPGLFWARSWVRAASDAEALTLMAVDGDRYFYLGRDPRVLVHIMLRRMHRPENGWERRAALGYEDGTHDFRHALIVGEAREDVELVSRAERYRHPVRWTTTRRAPGAESFLAVSPRSVRLSAFYVDEDAYLLRLVQMAPTATRASVDLPAPPESAAVVDLEGNLMATPVETRGNRIELELNGWQIATVRMEFQPGTSPFAARGPKAHHYGRNA